MWPARHDMTRDECRKCLRCLELDAYGSMVSVLRAQGPFTSEKQKLLQELAKVLHISNERHRAEIRRAVNDEKLAMIAEQLNGPNTGIDWTIEGRRTIPLLPRLKARNAFTTLANSLSLATVIANEREPTEYLDRRGSKRELQTHVKLEEDMPFVENNISDRKRPLHEVNALNKDLEIDSTNTNHIVSEPYVPMEEHKSSLPIAPPNKVLVVSPTLSETLDCNCIDKTQFEDDTNISQHQNIAIIPFAVESFEVNNIESCKDIVSKGNVNPHTFMQTKHVNATVSVCATNGTKSKPRIITTQNKVASKVTPVISVSNSAIRLSENNVQSEAQSVQTMLNKTSNAESITGALTYNSVKVLRSESTNSDASVKRVAPIVQSKTKPTVTAKTIISNNSSRVVTVCPGTTVSSGPGPPQIKQTTALTCKKLPATMLNHQSTKMSVALSSNKTVNISHHPNTKLPAKTNVIVIQKGHVKGVTLSHAGKEVLGKVIMGGKNLRVTNQQNAASVNVVQQHVTLNNGDQAVPTISPISLPHAESIQSNIKEALEKKQLLSQLIESSVIPSPESETVIEDSNTEDLPDNEEHNDSHLLDMESSSKIDNVIASTAEENQHRSI